MAIPEKVFTWQQGEDGTISMTVEQNDAPVNLTGYKLRMDVRAPSTGDVLGDILFTFNSDDITEVPAVDTVGSSDNEATLNSSGQINVVVPRSASLNTGAFIGYIGKALPYDIFLRDTSNKQRKILKGTIIFEPSVTKWT